MRDFEQRKEEIFARGRKKIARRKKITKRVVMTCVPLVLCVCIAGGWVVVRNGGAKLAMDSAAPEADMAMDSIAYGDANYNGAQVPEMSPADDKLNMSPADGAPEAGMQLELYRGGRAYAYTDQEILDLFLQILEETPADATNGDNSGTGYPEPGKIIEDEPYQVKLCYPDGQEAWYILRGAQLTSQDGEVYALSQEQASILHKLMEIDWEGNMETKPIMEKDAVIEAAKAWIDWNYYAVTATKNAQSGEWTVTFWSRSRMDSQEIIVDQYGSVLEVKAGSFLSESE